MGSLAEIEWECGRLINRYAALNDAHVWEEVADLFTEDGIFARPSDPDNPIVGRAAILQSFLARPPRLTRHVCTNLVVTPDGESAASAHSLVQVFTAEARGAPVTQLVGEFRDRLRLMDKGWKFSERRGSLAFR